MITKICIGLAVVLLLVIASICVFSVMQDHRAENKVFLGGHLPSPAMNGFYKGNRQSSTDWQGKEFDANANSGINIFGNNQKRYTFTTSTSKSLHSSKDVFRLTYNHSGNPWWLRFIVDEITQVDARHFQGKVYVSLGPISCTLTYFELQAV